MCSAPLALTDTQLAALRLTAASLPVEARTALLHLVAGYCEGTTPDDNAFASALDAALDILPACAPACACDR